MDADTANTHVLAERIALLGQIEITPGRHEPPSDDVPAADAQSPLSLVTGDCPGLSRLLAPAAVVAVVLFGALTAPPAAQAATCADHPNQASAQRAKDTLDADGDGIYCEALPCPCLKPGQRAAAPKPKAKPKSRAKSPRAGKRDPWQKSYTLAQRAGAAALQAAFVRRSGLRLGSHPGQVIHRHGCKPTGRRVLRCALRTQLGYGTAYYVTGTVRYTSRRARYRFKAYQYRYGTAPRGCHGGKDLTWNGQAQVPRRIPRRGARWFFAFYLARTTPAEPTVFCRWPELLADADAEFRRQADDAMNNEIGTAMYHEPVAVTPPAGQPACRWGRERIDHIVCQLVYDQYLSWHAFDDAERCQITVTAEMFRDEGTAPHVSAPRCNRADRRPAPEDGWPAPPLPF